MLTSPLAHADVFGERAVGVNAQPGVLRPLHSEGRPIRQYSHVPQRSDGPPTRHREPGPQSPQVAGT
jgi:hypothetical protein